MQRGCEHRKLTLCTKWSIYTHINNQQKTPMMKFILTLASFSLHNNRALKCLPRAVQFLHINRKLVTAMRPRSGSRVWSPSPRRGICSSDGYQPTSHCWWNSLPTDKCIPDLHAVLDGIHYHISHHGNKSTCACMTTKLQHTMKWLLIR